ERSWGGTAGNIAFTMKMLGGEPLVLSVLGKDGRDYLEYLKESGIKTDYIFSDPKQATATAYITTDADDNQITGFFGGPLGQAKERTIVDTIKEKFDLAIIAPTDKEVMMHHLKECKEMGIKTVFDPGQQITAFSEIELKKMISESEFVIGNDYEIKLLQDRTGWSAKEILENTEYLIVTLGEKGSIIQTAQGETIEAGVCPPLSFDDPTGAGDAYRAGFFVGYEKGKDLKTCAQMGAVAASYAIETYGTQQHKFTKQEFCERYETTFMNGVEKLEI
ncbi:MAG: carbohydrate kinase family protein, partial [Candidatus Magasanikbacteria bacterium]|nr:carbohydrate kinase family protein [Candidatus Magasanikbacteria bacterium]